MRRQMFRYIQTGRSLILETEYSVQQTVIQNLRISGQTWSAEKLQKELFLSSVTRWRKIFTRSNVNRPISTTASRPFSDLWQKVYLRPIYCTLMLMFRCSLDTVYYRDIALFLIITGYKLLRILFIFNSTSPPIHLSRCKRRKCRLYSHYALNSCHSQRM